MAGAAAVHAAPIDNGATVERDDRLVTVNADGTWTMERRLEVRIKDARLIKTLAQQSFDYNATLDTLDIVEAYTEKPDGSRIAVGPDRIREQQEAANPDVAMYQDQRVKVAIFPQVQAGDRLVMRMRQQERQPMMAGQFQDMTSPPWVPVKASRIVYDMPEEMPLYADVRGYKATSVPGAPGRRRYQYDYVDHPRQMPDPMAVSYYDYADRLVVSTMADYAGLAAAYQKGMAGKTTPTPAITALAQRITAGIQERRARALALGDWVRKNIRYVAVYIGAGGVVPHAADEVLAAGYGDCKDHEVLLEALLDAAGLPNTAALISAGNAYQLPSVGAFGVLNHVINYIPDLDLFIDATAADVAAGYLPAGDMGKTTILTRTAATRRTPSSQPSHIGVEARFVVDKSGIHEIVVAETRRGAAAEPGRAAARNATDDRSGDTILDAGDINGNGDEYATRIRRPVNYLSDDPRKIMIVPGSLLNDDMSTRIFSRDVISFMHAPTQDYPCGGDDMEHTIHIPIPNGFKVEKLPEPADLHAPQFDYVSHVERVGDEVVIKARYHAYPLTNVCTPDDGKARTALQFKILGNISDSLVLVAD